MQPDVALHDDQDCVTSSVSLTAYTLSLSRSVLRLASVQPTALGFQLHGRPVLYLYKNYLQHFTLLHLCVCMCFSAAPTSLSNESYLQRKHLLRVKPATRYTMLECTGYEQEGKKRCSARVSRVNELPHRLSPGDKIGYHRLSTCMLRGWFPSKKFCIPIG